MSESGTTVLETPPAAVDPGSARADFWRRVLLATFSGALFYLISTPSPYVFSFLHWVAWVPMLTTLEGVRPKRDFFLGWLGGAALNVAGFYWIVHTIVVFSNLPLPVALFVLGLFAAYGGLPFGILGVVVPRMRRLVGAWSILLTPAVWVSIEYLFPLIFPFHQGDLQFRFLPVMQVASITGIYGVSFLILAVNLAVLELWRASRNRTPRPVKQAAIVFGLTLLAIGWGAWRVSRIDAAIAASSRVKVGLIQGNLGVEERRRTPAAEIFARYDRLSREAVRNGATLLIWGEGASPYAPHRGWEKVVGLQKELGVDLILGAGGRDKQGDTTRHYNSAYSLHRDREGGRRYDKIVLLAFGEYMPFSSYFPWLKGKIKGIGDFTAGTEAVQFEFNQAGGTVRTLVLICYEAILNTFVREHAQKGQNLLVNITHDAWFGDTSCPHQFLMLVASRSVELGAPIARVANTGISAVIDPTGRIRGQTPLFQQAVQVEEVTTERFPTIYGRVGDLFALLCGLATAAAAGVYWRRGRNDVRADVA